MLHFRRSTTPHNKIDWDWWELIGSNNPTCHYFYLEVMKNNPPGYVPIFNSDLPF